jgi:hypothetical protein
MLLYSALAQCLVSWSLTLSPLSLTEHFTALQDPPPRHIASNKRLTWHPQFSLMLEEGHFQASLLYLNDTYAKTAWEASAGPRWSLLNDHLSFGAFLGVMRVKTCVIGPTSAPRSSMAIKSFRWLGATSTSTSQSQRNWISACAQS